MKVSNEYHIQDNCTISCHQTQKNLLMYIFPYNCCFYIYFYSQDIIKKSYF